MASCCGLIFRTIRQRAQPDTRVNAVVEFRITGRRDGGVDRYRLALTGGRASKSGLAGQEPALTLELEPVAFLRLAGGTASSQRLLIARKLKLHGDLMLALALPTALRLPTSRPEQALSSAITKSERSSLRPQTIAHGALATRLLVPSKQQPRPSDCCRRQGAAY